MSGHALEPVGLYDLAEITPERMNLPDKSKKKIRPENVKGIIVRVPKANYDRIVKAVEPILQQLGHKGYWQSGSAGSWHESHRYKKLGSIKVDAGDVDVHVPSDEIRQGLGLPVGADEAQVREKLRAYMQQHFDYVYGTGEQVHLGYPTGANIEVPQLGKELPTFYQVDLPTTKHAATTVRHHEHEYADNYKWDGQDQQMAMSSLVNSIEGHPEKTHLYHGFGGALKHRGTGEVQERDVDKIAQRIFNNPQANQDWLSTVDRILHHLPGGINSPRLTQFRTDMEKKYPERFIKEGTADWFANLRSKLNIV